MSNSKETKTNAMRILDSKGIKYKTYDYENTGYVSGNDAADFLGIDRKRMFKTLVTTSNSKTHYVFVVPVKSELDLKKAAKVVKEKYVEMITQKELLPLTGYVHGGCSPIGMKKFFKTVFDISAKDFESVLFSAGKVGHSVEINTLDIEKVIDVNFEDIKKNI